MQQFFIDYGLWLLVALLILIGLVFLVAGRGKSSATVVEEASEVVEPRQAVPIAPAVAEPETRIEPIVPVTPEPVAVAQPVPGAVPVSPAVTSIPEAGDNLLKMKGVGPKLNQLLIDLGVTRYAQIAAWTDADIAAIDAKLGNFKGRPVRDQWVDQAKYLAAGDTAGFEAKYGRI